MQIARSMKSIGTNSVSLILYNRSIPRSREENYNRKIEPESAMLKSAVNRRQCRRLSTNPHRLQHRSRDLSCRYRNFPWSKDYALLAARHQCTKIVNRTNLLSFRPCPSRDYLRVYDACHSQVQDRAMCTLLSKGSCRRVLISRDVLLKHKD